VLTLASVAFSCSEDGGSGAGSASREPAVTGAGLDGELADPHRLRNLAKLHADRDSNEGYEEAARLLRRLLEVEPDVPMDHLNLAKVLVFAGEAGASQKHVSRARELFGDGSPPDLDYVAGLGLKRLGEPAEGADAFRRVTERLPGHVKALYQLAFMLEETRDYAASEKSLRSILALAPRHRGANYKLSLVLGRQKRREEARKQREIFKSIPEEDGERDLEKCEMTRVTLRPMDRGRVEPPRARLQWRDVTEQSVGKAVTAGAASPAGEGVDTVASGDIDNDGILDVVSRSGGVVRLLLGKDDAPPSPHSQLAVAGDGATLHDLRLFDADHDGDLDALVLRVVEDVGGGSATATPWILRNNGDRTFLRFEPFGSFKASVDGPLSLDAHDVDQANDLDFVFAGGVGPVHLFLNKRDGTFDHVAIVQLDGARHVLVEDLDNDGAPDIFGASPDGWKLVKNGDPLGVPYTFHAGVVVEGSREDYGKIADACVGDVDNDGDLDVLLATEAGLGVLRNIAGGRLDAEPPVSIGGAARSIVAADFDGDGALEARVERADGTTKVLARTATPAYVSWRVRPQGGKDNGRAVGTVVEQFAGRIYQSRMIKEADGLHLGLGRLDRSEIDGLRLRWPQGIIQAIPASDLAIDAAGSVSFRQKAGLVASCPFLYGWGPKGWVFLTDVLGIAPLDEWLPPGTPPHKDPQEHVRIDGSALAVVDGKLRLAVTEELRETAYLDGVELVVVDHPIERRVFVDESTRQGMYEPLRLAIVAAAGSRAPADLRLPDGSSALDGVARRDGVYAHGYGDAPTQWGGWVDRYELEIVTPVAARALLLTGRIAWYDSTVVYSITQHGRTWGPLRLERTLPGGATDVLVEDLGVPAGMDRTLVADFGGRVLAAGTRLRLSGHHRFLWDEMRFVSGVEWVTLDSESGSTRIRGGGRLVHRTIRAGRATLGFHGLSRVDGDRARHEQTYVHADAAPDGTYAPAVGLATRYGDVRELLESHDDRLVVLVTGDRVEIELDAPPPPGEGASRTYFLRVSGWAKEASYHNRSGRWIAPLPLRAMATYPPTVKEMRDDEEYREYLRRYQTRHVGRRPL